MLDSGTRLQFATDGRKPPPPLVDLGHQSRGRPIRQVDESPLNPLRTLQFKINPTPRPTLALSLHRFTQDFRPRIGVFDAEHSTIQTGRLTLRSIPHAYPHLR